MSRLAWSIAFVFGIAASGCTKSESARTEVVTLAVEGMTCDGCEGTVSDCLARAPGVVKVESVDHETKRATVLVREGTDKAALCAAVKGEYTATVAH